MSEEKFVDPNFLFALKVTAFVFCLAGFGVILPASWIEFILGLTIGHKHAHQFMSFPFTIYLLRSMCLAYFWVGSIYGVMLQVWATWLLYAVLVDLTDDVADALDRPFDDVECIFDSPPLRIKGSDGFGWEYNWTQFIGKIDVPGSLE